MTELVISPEEVDERARAAAFLEASGIVNGEEGFMPQDAAEDLRRYDTSGRYYAAAEGGRRVAQLRGLAPEVRSGVHEVFRLLATQTRDNTPSDFAAVMGVREYVEHTDLPLMARVAACGLVKACQEYGQAQYRESNVPGVARPAYEMATTITGSTLEVD